MGAAQGEVVECDVEEGIARESAHPLQHLLAGLPEPLRLLWAGARPGEPVQPGPGLRLRSAQQQIAVPKTRERIEPGILRLVLRLNRLGLAEGRRALLPPARLVQGVGPRRPGGHPLKGIAAAVGQLDALLAERHGARHVPQGQGQLAEVAGD